MKGKEMQKAISIAIIMLLFLSLPGESIKSDSVKSITVVQDISIPGDSFIGSISLAEANLYEDDYNSKYLFPMQGICTVDSGKIAVIDNSYGRIHILDSILDNTFTFGSLNKLIYPTDIAYNSGVFYVSDALGENVQIFSSNGSFIKTLGQDVLNTPTGVAVSKGYIFVSDYFANRVYKIDVNGNIKKSVSINYPGGLTSDSGGNIYAVSMSDKTIYKFDIDLNMLMTINGKELLFPSDVTVDVRGNLFVSDRGLVRGKDENGKIVEYSSSGKYIKTIGKVAKSYPNQQDGALLTPAGITVDASGNVYVMDAGYYYWSEDSEAPFGHSIGERLSVFSNTGIFLSKKDFPQDIDGRLVNPVSATLDESGRIWVINYGGFKISELVQFSPAGTFIKRIDKLNGAPFPPAFSVLSNKAGSLFVGLDGGIAIFGSNGKVKNVIYDNRLGEIVKIIKGIDGYLYATMFNKDSVVKFSSSGAIIQIIPVCKFPTGIAQDKAGNFYIASAYDNRVHCYDNTFTELYTIGDGGGRGKMQFYIPEDVAVDKVGNIIVADTENGRISVFSKDGNLLYQTKRIFYEIASVEVEDGTLLVTDCFHNIVRVLSEEISSLTYDFYLSSYPESVMARPGEKVEFTIDVVNVGSNNDTYNLFAENIPQNWDATFSTRSFSLSSEEEEKIIFTVAVPAIANSGDSASITIRATSSHGATKSNIVKIDVSTHLPAKLSISNNEVMKGKTIAIPIVINGAKNLRGLSFTLAYNRDNISVINVGKGNLFKDGLIVYRERDGKILIAVSTKGKAAIPDSGDVVIVSVRGERVSINDLQLRDVTVENILDERINVLLNRGVLTVSPYLHLNFTDGITVTDQSFSFTGNVSSGSSLTINNKKINLNKDGSFSATVILTAQKNIITAVAVGNEGERTVVKKTVYFKGKRKIIIELQIGNPYMTVNGVKQEIDPGRGTFPVIINGWDRTVVPIRAIIETLGGTVQWNGKERKVTVRFNGTIIMIWINNPKALLDGIPVWIDVKNHTVSPIIMNDRTFVPLRFVAESLGCVVDWNGITRTVTITYNE